MKDDIVRRLVLSILLYDRIYSTRAARGLPQMDVAYLFNAC